ncbi:SMC-Scp complex subunit ScpB, partial [Candidatus Woesearchaeota archaeon]|nr:SMC-Scp complex subunit ScpB [Candidatus Woesearchaeota archaeon]
MSLKNKAEALLFSGGKAMDEEQIAALNDVEVKDVRKALKELQKDYAERDTSLKLYNEGSSWKLLVKDEHIDLVRRIVADTELSRATLETLAIIAYNQPTVLQSKVVDLRGGNAYEHIKELVELGFVTKNKEGRSYALRLTEKFFEYFDVEGGDNIKQVFKGVKPPKERQK